MCFVSDGVDSWNNAQIPLGLQVPSDTKVIPVSVYNTLK